MNAIRLNWPAQKGAIHIIAPLIIIIVCAAIWLYRDKIAQITRQDLVIQDLQQRVEALERQVLVLQVKVGK